jgi:hypothetical protein
VNLQYEFTYDRNPELSFLVVGTESGIALPLSAYIDSASDVTALDASIARILGLDWDDMPQVGFRGVTGRGTGARVGEIELLPLHKAELATILDVIFVEDLLPSVGNLLGLDILARFDIAISHSERRGYIGRSSGNSQ